MSEEPGSMQHLEETTKTNLKNAITLFQKTKDRRIGEVRTSYEQTKNERST